MWADFPTGSLLTHFQQPKLNMVNQNQSNQLNIKIMKSGDVTAVTQPGNKTAPFRHVLRRPLSSNMEDADFGIELAKGPFSKWPHEVLQKKPNN